MSKIKEHLEGLQAKIKVIEDRQRGLEERKDTRVSSQTKEQLKAEKQAQEED
jgi:hypothetical protein